MRTLLLALAGLPFLAQAGTALVLNSADENVSLVDTQTYTEVGRVPACKEPHHLMQTPDDASVVVACAMSNELVFFDPKTGHEQRRVKNISDPYQLGYSPDNKWLVTTSLRLDRVDLYNAKDLSLAARLPAATTPSHITFDRASQYAFVTLQASNEIMAINLKTQQVEWKMPVGPTPAGIVMTPDDKYLLVAIMGADYLEVIDWRTRALVKKVVIDKATHQFQPKGDGRHFFVSGRTMKGSISLFDTVTLTVVEKYDVPGGPDDMEVRADGKELWATARFARKVQVVDLDQKRVTRSIPVGRSPHGVYFFDHAPRK
jgi:DNA-binding beta-propeller fold protein YncE